MTDEQRTSNKPAEDSLLGAILLRPAIVGDLIGTLVPSDFEQYIAQELFSAMVQLHNRGIPIDPVTLAEVLRSDFPMTYLNETMDATPAISTFQHYADLVIDASRRRRVIFHLSDVIDQAKRGEDMEDVIANADPRNDTLVGPRSTTIRDLSEIREWTAASEIRQSNLPWLIPHLLKPQWRAIVIAGEGVGKQVLFRQLGLHAAVGLDPFDPYLKIEPLRVLSVDAENSESTIRHHHKLANKSVDLIPLTEGRYHLWHRPQGLELRDRVTKSDFEKVLQKTRPDIVFAGPLYKLFRRNRSEDMEQAALAFVEVIDDLRIRYNFAIVIEHHMPKGVAGAMRDQTPFGSSLWARWPELGVTLNDHGEAKNRPERLEVDLEFFRPPREPTDWPTRLTRGGMGQQIAWSPTYEFRRGVKIGARLVDDEWTYPATPPKPGLESVQHNGVKVPR